ncbi:Adhesion G protein-coupled receptor L3 [Acropora cervicornis]|uniref:Adhesion G protein-coupled receptor L3 n=1 Tax=Acropora cervicornis TaxID=6130 RepID=A0AAD9PQK3_ACRCE|nr:Adhesion G protein-coupled receptor L3 [Acropora cervicornis]
MEKSKGTAVHGMPLQPEFLKMMFYRFVVASAFVILSFASSVTACVESVEYCLSVENYLPVINRQQNNLTNYNAKNLRSRLSFDIPVRSLTLRTTFNWTHNGTVLVAGNSSRVHVKSSNGALNIFYSKLEDEGAYQFFASNELGAMFARKFWIKFAVSGAFRSPTSPINVTMIEGEPFVLRCPPRAYSYPRPEYDWISATGQVISNSSGPRIVMEPNGDLLFSYVNASDLNTFMNPRSGILSPVRCRARGVSLEIGPPVYFQINSTNATMSPSSPVRFYTKPQGVYTVLTGDQLYLNCTAWGRPVPEIFWKLNGSRINDSGDFFLLQNFNRTLRLGSLHPERHDGLYACEAVGNFTRTRATFEIKYLTFWSWKSIANDEYVCDAVGEHAAEVGRTDAATLRAARFLNRWSVDEHGILEIRQLQLKDFGVFQCVAKNPVSEGDRRTYLVVTGAPLPPTNVQLTDCSNHSTNITWDLRLLSDILPSAFIIEWRMKPNASHSMLPELAFSKLAEIPGSNRSYLVNNLEPWRYIEFRMRAKNSLGEGFPSKVLGGCITSAKKRPSSPLWMAIYPYVGRPLWNNTALTSGCSRSSYNFTKLQPNSEYELRIRAENVKGPGPMSPVIRALSGQTTPPAPAEVTVVGVESSSVEVEWKGIQVSSPKTVDGEFTESPPLSKRKRRGLPEIASTLPRDTIFVHVNTSLRGVVTGLRPWTTYTLAVAGYNNAGTGSLKYQRVTTIDSKNSYFLLSLRITSEVFTEDLKDQFSSKYKSLKTNLSNEVSSLYQNYTWFKKASLLGLRPGSVVADVQLEVASPNMSVVSDVVSTVDHLGNFSLDRNETKMTIEPEIQNVTVILSRVFHRIVISCFVIGGPDNLTITWYKASQVIGLTNRIKVETKLRNSTLTIQEVSEDDEGNYTCYAAWVFYFLSAPKCRAETKQGVAWTATAQGGIDIQPCPSGARGSATRECSVNAAWKNPSFISCYSFDFSRLQEELEAIIGGNQSDTSVGEFLSRVVIATQPITNDTTRPSEIDKGDLLIAVNILLTLAEYNNASQGNISSEEDVHNLATVVSNLLDPGNAITWQKLEQEGKGRSRTLIKAVDSYGLGVAAALNETTKSRTAATKNLLMTIKRITPDSQLPSEAFGSNYSRVVSVIYLTMNDIISLRRGTYENMTTLPNTTVVSSTVFPPPIKNFIEPVKIVLQNKRVSVPSGAALKTTCVFWRPGGSSSWETRGCKLVPSESDANKTTCNCDHLTIFASLMDPFDSEVGEAHRKALEMISIVGCSISLIAVLVTITVSLMFWRAIKSPRAKVILNLCIAIALSCIFVISEGFARDNKVACIVVAALLHYFLLAMFSWMLCEGVLLYILVVKVFGGFPVIIVAISLAVTQTVGYGTAHACWLDISSGLIWVFIAPVISIILVNIVVFILAIRKMMGTKHAQSKTQIGKVKAGIKASAVILPLLGITWLFGLFAFNSTTIAFKYIFAITNSLQGFMIFIFHCLLNKQRMRGRSSSGLVSSKSKQSPKSQAKFAVKQLQRVSKKKSIRTQDYQLEMVGNMDTLPNRAELKQHDNVRNEEDFEVKKEERKETIDTVQGDAEAFKLSGNKNVNVISQSAGTRIREIFHRGGFNVS